MFDLAAPAPNAIRIMGIDPGTDTLGIAIVDVDIDTKEIKLMYGHTFHASKYVNLYPEMVQARGSRDVRLMVLRQKLIEAFVLAEPELIAAESPFLQRGKVSAFEALVECYAMMRDAVWAYSSQITLQRIDPVTVKNYVGVSHKGTDKSDVHRAVNAIYKDRCSEHVDLSSFDEHANDAVAVCHVVVRNRIFGEVVESTRKKKAKRRSKNERRRGAKAVS